MLTRRASEIHINIFTKKRVVIGLIVVLVLGAALYLVGSAGLLKGNLAFVEPYADSLAQPSRQSLNDSFKDILLISLIHGDSTPTISFNSLPITIEKFKNNQRVADTQSVCVSLRFVKNGDSNAVISDVVDVSNSEKTTLTFPVNNTLQLDADLIDTFAVQAKVKQECINSSVDEIQPKILISDIDFTAPDGTSIGHSAEFSYSGVRHSVPIADANASPAQQTPSPASPPAASAGATTNLTVSTAANGQPAQRDIVLNSPDFVEILKVHMFSDVDTDLSKVKLTLTFPDNNERFPRILSRYMLMDFQLLSKGRSTPINNGILWFQTKTEKEFLLNGTLRAKQPYDLVVRAKGFGLSEADAALRPSFRLGISNYQNAANNLRVVGTDIISNRFTFIPIAAAQPAVEPVPADAELANVTGEVRNINLLNPAIITVPERLTGVGDLTEILKFRITTSAPKFIKQINFKLKNDPNMVDISKLTYALFDNTPVPGEPPVNIFASVNPNTKTLTFDYGNNILPSGHEFSLKVSPKQESIGTLEGKKVAFGFENGEAILVEGAPVVFRPAVGVFALWGRTYTFSDSHAPAVIIAPEVCSAAHKCTHPIVADTIASHTFQPIDNALVPVLGFTITPTQNTNVSSITVSLDNTVQDRPARGSQIKVQLVRVTADGTETVLGGPWLPTYNTSDTYSFRQLGGRMLFANRPEHYVLKAQVVGERENTLQNFRFIINRDDGILMRMYHGVSLQQNLVSNLMSIAPSVPIVPVDPQNDQLQIDVDNEEVLVEADPLLPARKPDLCVNIAGTQETMPDGKMGDGVGGCVDIPVAPVKKSCTEQGKFDYTGPDRGGLTKGTCIPCPTNLYIQSNMTCFIVDSGEKKTPDDKGDKAPKDSNKKSENKDQSGLRGSAIEGVGSLGQSQRLSYVPERGNTGPDASLYLALVGLSPVAAYALRKLRK